MKPAKKTPAHKSDLLAELVCSNSLKAARIDSAAGLLKGGFNTDISFEASAAASDEELKAAAARYVYGEALRSCEINFSEITVCTDKNEDGSIVISKVIIYSDADKERIRAALGSAAENIEVEIINERCDK